MAVDEDPVAWAGRQEQDGACQPDPAGRPARRAGRPRSRTPTIGMARAWARPLAVASPTRSPVNAPGPVPTTIAPDRCRASTPLGLQQPVESGQELLAVALPGRPGSRRPDRRRAARAPRPSGWWPCRWPAGGARHGPLTRRPPGSARGRARAATSSIVRGSSPAPIDRRRRGARRAAPAQPLGPLDQAHSGRPGARRGGQPQGVEVIVEAVQVEWKRGSRPGYSAIRT